MCSSDLSSLVFTYQIEAGQTDGNGISIAANSLGLNGGTIADAAGNAATLAHAAVADNAGYLVDTTSPNAPVIAEAIDGRSPGTGVISDNGVTNDPDLVLTGTAEAGSTVTVYDSERVLGTATADDNGAWTFTTDKLDDSTHAFTATAMDAAGNVSGVSADYTVTVKTSVAAPVVALVEDTGNSAIAGSFADQITSNGELTFSDPAPGVSREIIVDGDPLGSQDDYDPTLLEDGPHTVSVTDTDDAGNSNTTEFSFTLDTSAPATPVEVALAHDTGDTSDRITNDASLHVTNNASLPIAPPEPGTTRTYTVTSSDPNDPNGGSSYTTESYNPALLSDGDYTVTVTDTDAAGNSTSADISFTLDRTISSASAALTDDAGESPSDHLTNNAAVEFSELDPDASRVFTVDGTEVDSYDPDTQFEADGSHTVSITDTDTAGNISTASVTFTLDRTADQSSDLAVAVDLSSLPSGVTYDPSAGSFTSVDETGQARGTVSFVEIGRAHV